MSSNLHSTMNALFGPAATAQKSRGPRPMLRGSPHPLPARLGRPQRKPLVTQLALKNGMTELVDNERQQHRRTDLRYGRLRPQS